MPNQSGSDKLVAYHNRLNQTHLLSELPVVYCGCGLGGGVFLVLHVTTRLPGHIKTVEGGGGGGGMMRISRS